MAINPEILEIFRSSNPDLDLLTREPGGVAEEWQQMKSRAWDFVRRQKPWENRRSLAINWGALPPTTGLDSLGQMAGRRPFSEANFPYNGTYLHLRMTDPGAEEAVHLIREIGYNIFVETHTSSTSPQGDLLFRTDAWIDKRGRPRWFIAPPNPAEVSLLLIACVGAILDLGEMHFAMQGHIPSPS